MGITELNHINIRTTKMEETKDFFIDIVGLEIGWRPDFDSHGYWLYCGDGFGASRKIGTLPDGEVGNFPRSMVTGC